MAYRVFITHAYDTSSLKIYFALVQKLNEVRSFSWENLSLQYDMRHGVDGRLLPDNQIRDDIGERIRRCDVLLALTRPIIARRAWPQWEVKYAKRLQRPVIGIARYKKDKVSRFVRKHADEIVDTWRVDHIINAIKWQVSEADKRHTVDGAAVEPPEWVANPEDHEEIPVPSPDGAPEPPPEYAAADAAVDSNPEFMPDSEPDQRLPRDVITFGNLGAVIPERLGHVARASKPRWWWPGRQ